MTLGEFLQQVIEWIYELWPLRIIREWEQGVRLRLGNRTGLLTSTNGWFGTGLHGFWPLMGEIIREEVNAKVVETPWQTVGDTSWSLAARYKIRDLGKLYVEIQDHEDTILNVIAAAAAEYADKVELTKLTHDEFTAEVKKIAQARLTKWGVTLLEVNLYNKVKANTLRLLNE